MTDTPLTPEARDGIEAAFLRILRARHPGAPVEALHDHPDPLRDRQPSTSDDDRFQASA